MIDVSSPREYARTIFIGERCDGHRPPLQKSVAERNFNVARGLHHFAVWWNQPQTIDRFGDRNVVRLIILVADHRSEMSFIRQLHCFNAEARAENSIERCRRAAALQMSEHTRTRFFAGAFGDLARDKVAERTQAKFTAF